MEERLHEDACVHALAFSNKDGSMECSKCGKLWDSLEAYVKSFEEEQ